MKSAEKYEPEAWALTNLALADDPNKLWILPPALTIEVKPQLSLRELFLFVARRLHPTPIADLGKILRLWRPKHDFVLTVYTEASIVH